MGGSSERERLIRSALQLGKDIWHDAVDDRVQLAASGVAFCLTLSMLPLLLLIVSVAAHFVSEAQIQSIGQDLTRSLGAGVGEALRSQVLSIVQNRGVLTGISLLVGLWSGSQIFVIIEAALNQIWGVKESRPLWVTRGLALAMVVVTGVLVLLAVMLTYLIRLLGGLDIRVLGYQVHRIPWFMTLLFNYALPWLVMVLAFLIIYRYLSSYAVTWGMVLPGALIAGLLWTVALQVFSWYTSVFADYNALYGSLGGLVLLMLWFNYSAVILLLGAEISSVLHQHRLKALASPPVPKAEAQHPPSIDPAL